MIDDSDIGRLVWVRNSTTGETVGPLLVIDCADKADKDRLRQRGVVVEVDYDLAMQWAMQGPVRVEVLTLADSAQQAQRQVAMAKAQGDIALGRWRLEKLSEQCVECKAFLQYVKEVESQIQRTREQLAQVWLLANQTQTEGGHHDQGDEVLQAAR
jgi:hypothetical protein